MSFFYRAHTNGQQQQQQHKKKRVETNTFKSHFIYEMWHCLMHYKLNIL